MRFFYLYQLLRLNAFRCGNVLRLILRLRPHPLYKNFVRAASKSRHLLYNWTQYYVVVG
jgi:hypothetical protein